MTTFSCARRVPTASLCSRRYVYSADAGPSTPTALPGGSLAVANATVFRDSGAGQWELLDSATVGGGANASWRAAAVSNAGANNLAVICGAGGIVAVLDPATARLVDVSPPPSAVAAAAGSSGTAVGVDLLAATVVPPVARAPGLPASDPEAWVVGTRGAVMGYTPRTGAWRWPTPATAHDAAVLAGGALRGVTSSSDGALWAVGATAGGDALIARVRINASLVPAAIAALSPVLANLVIEVVDTGLGADVTVGHALNAIDGTASLGLFAVGAPALVLRRFRPAGAVAGGEVWAVVPTTPNATGAELRGVGVSYDAIGVRAAGDRGTVLRSVVCAEAANDGHALDFCAAQAPGVAAAGGIAMVTDVTFHLAPDAPATTFTVVAGAKDPVMSLLMGTIDGRMWTLQWNGWDAFPYSSRVPAASRSLGLGGVGLGDDCTGYMWEYAGIGVGGTAGIRMQGDIWHAPFCEYMALYAGYPCFEQVGLRARCNEIHLCARVRCRAFLLQWTWPSRLARVHRTRVLHPRR